MMHYIEHYRVVHQTIQTYGTGLTFHLPYLASVLLMIRAKSVLNFGSGKSQLTTLLAKYGVTESYDYDPAIPERSTLPDRKFDVVINTDVLEHIPEQELPQTIQQFKALSPTSINIPDLQKARLVLPNGENAHCTLKTPQQWCDLFAQYYQHVRILPHHSHRHTIIFATDEALDLERVQHLSEVVLFTRKEYTLKTFGMTQPFRRRLRAAIRLLRGYSGFVNKKY